MQAHRGSVNHHPPSGYAWYVVFILTLAATISFIDRQIIAVMVEPIKEDLGISDTQIGLLLGLAFVPLYTIMTVPAGWLADRFSRRLTMGTGVFLWSLMTALSGFADTYAQLFLARMGVGIGEALLAPAAYSMLTDYFRRERLPVAIALFSSAPFIGVGLAFMLGGPLNEYLRGLPPSELPLIGSVFSWQMTFLIIGLPGLVLAVFVTMLREPVRSGKLAETRSETDSAQTNSVSLRELYKFIMERRSYFSLHFIAFLCLSTQGFALFAWVTSFFVRVHNFNRADIGIIYGAIALTVGVLGSMAGGIVSGRMMRRGKHDATLRLVMWSAIGICPIAIAATLVPSPWLAICLLAPITFFMAMPPGLGSASLQIISPNELRGQIMALYLITVNFLSYLLAPLIVAVLTESVFGYPEAIGLSLSTMAAIFYPVAAVCLAFGLSHYRNAVKKAEGWNRDI